MKQIFMSTLTGSLLLGSASIALAAQDIQTEAKGAAQLETKLDETVALPPAPVLPAPTAAAEAKPECELHIFPSPEGEAMTTGWLSGLGVVGAVADTVANDGKNKSEGDYLRDALGPEMQIYAMKSMDVVEEMNLPPSQIIFQEPLEDRKVYTKEKARLSDSAAPCYFELIVTQNFYRKAAIYGRSLNNRYIFKDFRDGVTKAKLVKGRGGNGLKHFPPKTPEESEMAEEDLRRAFVENFQEFAKKKRLK
jgi:hypothetical protein